MRIRRFLWAMCLGLCLQHGAHSGIPSVINYSGYLTDASGGQINSNVTILTSLFDQETDGQLLWTETQQVSVTNGTFTIALGKVNPLSSALFTGSGNRYLEIKINDEVLSPRDRLGTVPYALVCKDVVGSVNASSIQVNGANVVSSSGEWVGSMTAIDNEVTRIINDLGLTNGGPQAVTLTGDVTGSGTGTITTTIADGAVKLGSKTTGHYVATVSGGSNLSVSGSGKSSATITVDTVSNPTFSTSVSTPLVSNISGGGTLMINATTSSGSDKISFTFGAAGSGTEKASLDESGNFVAVGSITGSNLLGTNTGDQTISLTGDVTGSGTGSFATTIANNAVTLGTKTSGNYVATVAAGTNMSVSGSGSPTAAVSIGTVSNPSFSTSVTTPAVASSSALTVTGVGTLTLAASTSGVNDKISFHVDGSEMSYIDSNGNFAAVGNVTGANLSGTNTGDQTISLTGDVTGSGTGTFATTIANNAVTLGTKTSGNYVATAVAGSNISVSGSGSATAAITIATVANPTFSNSVTTPAVASSSALTVTGVGTLTLAASTSGINDKISFHVDGNEMSYMDSSGNFVAVGNVTGANLSGTNTGDQTITLTGDVTGSGTGSFATTIANNAVTLGTKTSGNYVATAAAGSNISVSGSGSATAAITIATVANPSFSTSVTTPAVASSSALTVTGIGTLTLAASTSGINDKISFHVDGNEMSYMDSSGNFVAVGNVTGANLSGTNTGDQTISLTGDVTGSGTGSFTTTIANNAVTLGTKTSGNYVATAAAGSNISVSGSGSATAAITIATVANPSFSTSVTTPMVSNAAGGGAMTINATTSAGADKISFTFGTAGSGTERASLDESGNFVAVGSVTGSNLSGTNTGDQTISLTGDVTGSGTGSFATTIANNAVTLGTKTSGNYVATVSAGTNMSVSGSGTPTAAVTVGTINNPSFSTSVTSPLFTNAAGGGTLTINATTSSGTDAISFTFGTAGSGTQVASLDESGNLSATGNVKSTGGCFGRTYIATSANSTGNGGSRTAADTLCNTARTKSKVCTYDELIESSRCGVTMPSSQGWINSSAQADCNAWSSGSILVNGMSWNTSGYTAITTCNTSQPFLCCV